MLATIVAALAHVINAFLKVYSFIMKGLDSGLRAPLEHYHVHGATETLCVAMVPFLCMVAAWFITRGIFRLLIVALFGGFMIYVLVSGFELKFA